MRENNDMITNTVNTGDFAVDVNKVLEQVMVEVADIRQLTERVTSLRGNHLGFFNSAPALTGASLTHDNIQVLQQLYDSVMDAAHHYLEDRSNHNAEKEIAAFTDGQQHSALFSS